jgi:BRCT domain type II-containing protein
MNTAKNQITGKRFVITGVLAGCTRFAAGNQITSRGGTVQTSVRSNTDYLIAGLSPGSKLLKAQQLGIKVLNEVEFNFLLAGRPLPDNEKWIKLAPKEVVGISKNYKLVKTTPAKTVGRKFKFDEYGT